MLAFFQQFLLLSRGSKSSVKCIGKTEEIRPVYVVLSSNNRVFEYTHKGKFYRSKYTGSDGLDGSSPKGIRILRANKPQFLNRLVELTYIERPLLNEFEMTTFSRNICFYTALASFYTLVLEILVDFPPEIVSFPLFQIFRQAFFGCIKLKTNYIEMMCLDEDERQSLYKTLTSTLEAIRIKFKIEEDVIQRSLNGGSDTV